MEFVNGLEGKKAARLFTPQERGANKYNYCRRKIFWDKVSEFVRAGISAEDAIERIYQEVYGERCTVSQVLTGLRKDTRIEDRGSRIEDRAADRTRESR